MTKQVRYNYRKCRLQKWVTEQWQKPAFVITASGAYITTYSSECQSRWSAEWRHVSGAGDRCVIDGPLKFAARCREAGIRFPDCGDSRNSGACVAREIASARHVTRRFWTGVDTEEHSCRERLAEAENTQWTPWFLPCL